MSAHAIRFINFTKLKQDKLLQVLQMRNSPEVRQFMTNDAVISEKAHLAFCATLKERADCLYLLVEFDQVPCGAVTIKKINLTEHSAEIGKYIIKKYAHYSADIALALDLLFEKMEIENCYCYVRKDNLQALLHNIMKLHAQIIGEEQDNYQLKFSKMPWKSDGKWFAEKSLQLSRLQEKYRIEFML